MHLAYRWFTGLGFDQEIPHHSTFSKNRHGRFQESSLFLELFERIVQQCMNVGLLKGVDLSADSTQIRADANPDRTITHEELPEVAKVNRTVREYVEQVERENVVAELAQTPDPSGSEVEAKPELRRTYRNSPPAFAHHDGRLPFPAILALQKLLLIGSLGDTFVQRIGRTTRKRDRRAKRDAFLIQSALRCASNRSDGLYRGLRALAGNSMAASYFPPRHQNRSDDRAAL